MKLCYVDESGCTGILPSAISDIQPAFVFAAIMFDYSNLHKITESFLQLKQKFYPGLFPSRRQFLSGILPEVKGADLRKQIAKGNRNERRHAFGFIDGIIRIINDHQIAIAGRVWIKGIAAPFDGRAIYTFS